MAEASEAKRDGTSRTLAAIDQIATAQDQASVLAVLHTCLSALGAGSGLFISFVRDNNDVSATRLMAACDPAVCQRYLQAGCQANDPWLTYASHRSEPTLASKLDQTGSANAQGLILAMHKGFASALLAPAHSGPGHSRVSLLCLGSEEPGYFEAVHFSSARLLARLLAAELHDWWLAQVRRELVLKARITAADLELLRHQRAGHSSKRIASDLQVSQSAVNSRFQRVNTKLGVPNRKMAARLALECGLLLG